MAASTARLAALDVVSRVRERSAYAHETFDAVVRKRELASRDIGFAARLAYGTIAARGTLDEVVARFVKEPAALEPRVSDALAVTAYELLFASTPARAAVNEGVEMVRHVQPRAAGLANAVLRRVAESVPEFPWGDPAVDPEAFARLHCHPRWLADLLVEEYGRDVAAQILAADNEPAPLYLAHLPFETDFETVVDMLARDGAGPRACVPAGCIVVDAPSKAISSGAVRAGMAVVADAGAQFTALVAARCGGPSIVEIGAGRGTKSLIVAGVAHIERRDVRVIAVDNHQFKLDALAATALKSGARTIETVCADATLSLTAVPAMSVDTVLLDAPCSGLGTLRRHPDRRWRATSDEIDSLATLASRLLASSAALVKPGGFMVYSTCTIVRRENADVIDAFLASELGEAFTIEPLTDIVPDEWRRFLGPEGFFQSLPEPGSFDGHFVARLRRDH